MARSLPLALVLLLTPNAGSARAQASEDRVAEVETRAAGARARIVEPPVGLFDLQAALDAA